MFEFRESDCSDETVNKVLEKYRAEVDVAPVEFGVYFGENGFVRSAFSPPKRFLCFTILKIKKDEVEVVLRHDGVSETRDIEFLRSAIKNNIKKINAEREDRDKRYKEESDIIQKYREGRLVEAPK